MELCFHKKTDLSLSQCPLLFRKSAFEYHRCSFRSPVHAHLALLFSSLSPLFFQGFRSSGLGCAGARGVFGLRGVGVGGGGCALQTAVVALRRVLLLKKTLRMLSFLMQLAQTVAYVSDCSPCMC